MMIEDDDVDNEENHLALRSSELCARSYKMSQELGRAENNSKYKYKNLKIHQELNWKKKNNHIMNNKTITLQ